MNVVKNISFSYIAKELVDSRIITNTDITTDISSMKFHNLQALLSSSSKKLSYFSLSNEKNLFNFVINIEYIVKIVFYYFLTYSITVF